MTPFIERQRASTRLRRHGSTWDGIGSYDKATLRVVPPSVWRWAERAVPLPKRFAVSVFLVSAQNLDVRARPEHVDRV
jgi:hypothetical protein